MFQCFFAYGQLRKGKKSAVRPVLACVFAGLDFAIGARYITLIVCTLQTQNSPGRWAQLPCPAAGSAEFPLARGQPPPHPLAPRAVAFAWHARRLRGQTRRASQGVPRDRRAGCFPARCCCVCLPLSWVAVSPFFAFSFAFFGVFTILSERTRFFKREYSFFRAERIDFPAGASYHTFKVCDARVSFPTRCFVGVCNCVAFLRR